MKDASSSSSSSISSFKGALDKEPYFHVSGTPNYCASPLNLLRHLHETLELSLGQITMPWFNFRFCLLENRRTISPSLRHFSSRLLSMLTESWDELSL